MKIRLARKAQSIPNLDGKFLYHLPPTAIPVSVCDFWHGIAGIIYPESSSDDFLSALVRKIKNPNCILTSSGRSALKLILISLGNISSRVEVIVPAYSCPTVPQAVLEAGFVPVYCDVIPETLNFDPKVLKKLINEDTLAIIPTHLYGLAQDITDLVTLGRENDIVIIEDAAQSFGATIHNMMVGNAGDFGFFSLGRGKCLPTGHGGIIIAKDRFLPYLKKTIRELIPFGVKRDYVSILHFLAYSLATTPMGWWFIFRSPMNPASNGMDANALSPIELKNFSPTQAGIGKSILSRLEKINTIQRKNAKQMISILSNYDFVSTPAISSSSAPVYLRLPIIAKNSACSNKLYDLLSKSGIGVSRSYFRTLPEIFSNQNITDSAKFPGARHLANCLLTLPTHHYLGKDDFIRIQNVLELI